MARHREDHFADVAGMPEIAEGLGLGGEREGAVRQWRGVLENSFQACAEERGLMLDRDGEVDRVIAREMGAQIGLAEFEEATTRSEECEARVELWAREGVENDIDATALR